MKRIITALFCLLSTLILCFDINAQSVSTDKNAVKQSVYTQATTTLVDGSDPTKALISIKYFDGLGRPLQQVGYRLTPQQKDLVTENVVYDLLSRPSITHLPTPTTNSSGSYVSDPSTSAISFYDNDAAPFSKSQYEQAPLNRVIKQYGAGQAWQSTSKGISMSYEVATETVRKYELNDYNEVIMSGNYPAGKIYKNRVTDEQGHQVLEFKDAMGHLILKQVQDDVSSWISTYYVYDNLWRLVAVIQPSAYELNQSITLSSVSWNEGIFLYKYDGEGRLIAKKVPSADWEYFVFDNWDRMVYSQDGLQRELGKWKFYKYDILNRVIMSGLKSDTRGRVALQTEATSWSGGRYESKSSASPLFYSTTSSYPSTITATDVSQITYYDDYQYWLPTGMSFVSSDYGNTAFASAKGLLTGMGTKNLESGTWLYKANYYDLKSRIIQIFQQNVFNKIDRQDFLYGFSGNLLKQRNYYTKADGTTIVDNTQNNYDHGLRRTSVRHGLSATSNDEVVQLNYDEVGRLSQKRIKATSQAATKYLKAKAILFGAIGYNPTMSTSLTTANLVPVKEPYTAMGNRFVHTGGGGNEQTTLGVLSGNAGTANAIVDWVFIELRSSSNPANILKTRAALLQVDGDIVDVDGVSDVNLGTLPNTNYYVAIKHRNHLGAMTAEAVSFANTSTVVDFITRTPAQIYDIPGTSSNGGELKYITQGYALWAGDADSNGKIAYQGPENDPNVINSAVMWHPNNPEHLSNYTYTGYQVQDVNLDGNVVYQGGGSDVNIIFNFKETHPFNTERLNNFIFNEQLPTGSAIISATPTLSALQTIDYKYHIRGGLAGINLNAANQPTPNSQEMDLFSYKLEYESAGQWDGNIGKQTWNNTSNQVRSYTFAYDYAKRLKSGTYSGVGAENYSLTNVNYDKNGNILNLVRNGNLGSSFGVMDNLTYTYTGNKLYKVEDAVSGDYTVDFVNRNAGTNDYDYYSDGSLKKDLNKEITQIDYDPFLKLPKQITLTNNRWIKITYAGDGRVLKRTYSTGEYWEYDGALVHKNGQPYQLATPEGRATYASGAWTYEYFIQDHLGNTRVSFKANGSTPQATDYTNYDPWGIELNGTGLNNPVENRFKYQSKESLSLFSLGGINDFGARYYDKTVGRWWGIDPLAEKMPTWSSYAYAFDNPIKYIDYNGLIPIPVNKLFKSMAHRIDSWFGPRNTGLSYASKFHKGLDINFGGGRADYGAPVLGTHDGIVSVKDNLKGNEGRMVTVTSPDGKFRTRYLHLSSINVEDGQKITEATQVGEIGGSRKGKEFGGQVHLHYQIERLNEETGKFEPYNPTEGKERKESNVVDPQSWIQKKDDGLQMPQLPTMGADATRVERSQFFDGLKNLKAGSYKVVDGKLVPN